MNYIFTGTVLADGKLHYDDNDEIRFEKKRMRLCGQRFELTLEGQREYKTNEQLAYLFGVVYPTWMEYAGNDPDERPQIHLAFKEKFFTQTVELVNKATGEIDYVDVPKSLKRASVQEASQYIDRVVRYMAGHGVIVPSPNKVRA